MPPVTVVGPPVEQGAPHQRRALVMGLVRVAGRLRVHGETGRRERRAEGTDGGATGGGRVRPVARSKATMASSPRQSVRLSRSNGSHVSRSPDASRPGPAQRSEGTSTSVGSAPGQVEFEQLLHGRQATLAGPVAVRPNGDLASTKAEILLYNHRLSTWQRQGAGRLCDLRDGWSEFACVDNGANVCQRRALVYLRGQCAKPEVA